MRIEIEYKSNFEDILIFADSEKNIFTCNGRDIQVSIYSFKEALFDIIIGWENEMINYDIKDAEYYRVTVFTDDENIEFVGHGTYPDNFDKFKDLILEVANG